MKTSFRTSDADKLKEFCLEDYESNVDVDITNPTPSDLFEIVNSGDILLCQSKGFSPKITRVVTQCYWDHVGLFLWCCLNSNGPELCFFEATENGVHLYRWKDSIDSGWLNDFSAMALRSLQFEDSGKASTCEYIFTNFALQSNGKQYSITPYFSNNFILSSSKTSSSETSSSHPSVENMSNLTKELSNPDYDASNLYFCSSLIANCYLEAKLIDHIKNNDFSPNHILPVHFSQKSKIIDNLLVDDCSLGPEILINVHCGSNYNSNSGIRDSIKNTSCCCTVL